MLYNIIRIKKMYSKGITDRKVGEKFIVYYPYYTYTHYRYEIMRKMNALIDVHDIRGRTLGWAYIVSVDKIKFIDINENELCVKKEKLTEIFGEKNSFTKVTLRWDRVW